MVLEWDGYGMGISLILRMFVFNERPGYEPTWGQDFYLVEMGLSYLLAPL